jgi:voltage-gated sodium channel
MEIYPQAWLFFLIFILASTFTLLNLFIAVIVNAIQQEQPDNEQSKDSELTRLHQEIRLLREDLARVDGLIPKNGKP